MHEWIARQSPGTASAAGSQAPVLYCFHHAGGSASSYNSWRPNWPATSRLRCIELPGRPGALQPLPFIEVGELVPPLLDAFLAQLDVDVPYAFYGHSLGALVAYRLARALVARGHATPAFLAVSGRRAPSCPLTITALWNLPEDALIASLRTLGGMAESLLASAKWRSLFLPCMRADLRLSDEYVEAPQAPLPLRVIALRGHEDPIAAPHEVDSWARVAGRGFEHYAIPGAHFFTPEGMRLLQRRLQEALAASPLGPLPQRGEAVCVS